MFSVQRLCRALLPLAVAVPLGVVTSSAAYADYDLGVIWPDATGVIPGVTDYQITVIDSGPGDLFLTFGWHNGAPDFRQSIPHNGTVSVAFPVEGSDRLRVERCVDTACDWAGVASPTLAVYHKLPFTISAPYGQGPVNSPGTFDIVAETQPVDWTPTVRATYDWRLLSTPSPDSAQIDAGSIEASAEGTVSIPIPSGLTSGVYGLEVVAHRDFGGVTITSEPVLVPMTVDVTAPETSITLSRGTIFPERDGYADQITVTATSSEAGPMRLALLTEDGQQVGDARYIGEYRDATVTFDAGGESGQIPAAGTYWLEIRATDSAGNVGTSRAQLVIDRAKYKRITVSQKISAADSLIGKYVGKCSSLVTPSSHRWPGSLGYYSQTKCKKSGDAGVVIGRHGAWLPDHFASKQEYQRLQVTAYGGGAKGTRSAYAVIGYITTTNKFWDRRVFTATVGNHPGYSVNSRSLVHEQDGRYFMVWDVGLMDGSRYDIRDFTLTVTYLAMVEPDGTILVHGKSQKSGHSAGTTTPPRVDVPPDSRELTS